MNMIPKGHCHVEPVADSYFMTSIKDAELVVIKSAKSKVSRVLTKFLWSSENKPKIIQLVLKTTEDERKIILVMLRGNIIVSRESEYKMVTKSNILPYYRQLRTQEEDHTIATAVAVKKKQRGIKFSSDPHQEILILFYVYIHISLFFSARRKLL